MNFPDILASLIHDMKNSLGLVINTIDDLGEELHVQENPKLGTLQHEARRLNSNLITLLSLYKIDKGQLTTNIEEIDVEQFLYEISVDNQATANNMGITISYESEEGLVGYFDEWLMRGVINSLIGNGLRYSASQILLHAEFRDDYLVLSIDDDGNGFPQSMIEAQSAQQQKKPEQGETQLGHYFASLVAHMHSNGEREGFIKLANNQRLGGGSFSLWLP
ncbi:MAG: HAMP domain-containing histidine kinase [Candidatus Thiodiazotropha lotti]|uniref:Histidine kinase domain-containing protein n=1 Tax=Candidatus Thiodiazotropha endoloripes TaxID=1818881 RepID=A0A1E2UKX1_9GAMM|nr:HAMP domain-containing sensor histidine kinase [Candidatus Thiodiazotropha endoloripes]MCG7898872.1 HAMP domain-containing histidine kinase [Candidatus Thiodiazotropha weberae]MCG7992225.1 HAMP domain-containing histidine kinase [Candidatus Thiodiazotropha lotti]MCG8001503.1 HAMP domain-containing histidine kinase [Candidatus Thiodiazotropha lotti]MCW4183883.1 HAMP domain-containing histidine kinase [Candidatus Thiodiazotropha weberae]MCW4193277.1 HAMP domain-containing histidine kinase [Ca